MVTIRKPRSNSNKSTYFVCVIAIALVVTPSITFWSTHNTLKLRSSSSTSGNNDETISIDANHSKERLSSSSSSSSLSTTTNKGASNIQYRLFDDLITKSGKILKRRHADALWPLLIDEAVAYSKAHGGDGSDMNIMEVGMHSAGQSIHGATRNLQVYGIEPSPKSGQTIIKQLSNPRNQQASKNIRFYQMAAGATTGLDLDFTSEGSTGDHVGGGIDIWTMTKLPPASSTAYQKERNKVTVKSVAIDDIILSNNIPPTHTFAEENPKIHEKEDQDHNNFFIVKIDTQGFEPSVFAGLKKSIQQHRIDFIITEYWPKGIDFMNDSLSDPCVKPVQMLQFLASNGYKLFANMNVSHPGKENPTAAKSYINDFSLNGIPFHDLKAYCMWFYDIEKKFPSDAYKMGYWTDILAVSPKAKLAKIPATELGQILLPHLQ